jgi:hypothetical protein
MAPASIRNGEAGVWRAQRHRASAVRDTAFERHLMHFAKVPPDYEAAGVRGALQMNREVLFRDQGRRDSPCREQTNGL